MESVSRVPEYCLRARWYDPVTGRWLSNDPIGISGGLNQYVFCANNPVNFRDPFGLAVYFVGEGNSHCYIVVSDVRSKTGYSRYDFQPEYGGHGNIEENVEAITSQGVWQRTEMPAEDLPAYGLKPNTTHREEVAIRNLADVFVMQSKAHETLPYLYVYNNCASNTRNLLYEGGFLASPNTKGYIYDRMNLQVELQDRISRREKRTKKRPCP